MPEGKVTVKNLYKLVVDEIEKRVSYRGTTKYGNQTSRVAISPMSMSATGYLADVNTGIIVNAMQDILSNAVPGRIVSGLKVTETTPISNKINVSAGSGTVGGFFYTLESATTIIIPFDSDSSVFYINLFQNRVTCENFEKKDRLTIAKIVVPNPGTTIFVQNKRDDSWEAYIIQYRSVTLYQDGNGKFEEESLDLLRDNIGEILADNLIGNIKLSENLTITNTAGTLILNSDKLELKDLDGNVVTRLNRYGTYFYNNSGSEVGRFAVDGARIGNITITPTTIQSTNFVSGALGSGFKITDSGNAEFNNILARGKITTSVFEKQTISVVGGNLLVMDGDKLEDDM